MNGTTPSPRLNTNDEFRIVQGDRHGRVVSVLCCNRLWVVWWDNPDLEPNVEAEIVTARTCRLETEEETARIYLERSKFKPGPGYGAIIFKRRTLAGFDAANQAALNREDIDYNPPDKRTVGQRLEDGFGMLEGREGVSDERRGS